MRADEHVVTDLDLVVELDAVADHRVIDRATIDGGVGADLDVAPIRTLPICGTLSQPRLIAR